MQTIKRLKSVRIYDTYRIQMGSNFNYDVNGGFDLDQSLRSEFSDAGFIKIDSVFEEKTLEHYGKMIGAAVERLNTMKTLMEDRTTYEKAFVQLMNLWRFDEHVREFVFGKKLANMAAQLLGVERVRLYHDQALFKEPGGGITPWHADQYYWPLDSDRCVTSWIPLQPTSFDMGPLSFAIQSHRMSLGRDMKISDESEKIIAKELEEANFETFEEEFALGDVSFHSGWTFHRAGSNQSERMRGAMTVIYIDSEMRLIEPTNENQQNDREKWCPGIEVGDVIDSEINPILN